VRLLAVLLVLTATPVGQVSAQLFGQDKPQVGPGWGQLGEMMAGGLRRDEQRAYEEQLRRNYETMADIERIRAAESERDLLRVQDETRQVLAGLWVQAGIPASEAASVAAAFTLNEQQAAFNARALREGPKATLDAALRAYNDYQYLMANQLMVAALRAVPPEDPATASANKALAELDAAYTKNDASYLVRRPVLSARVAAIKASRPPGEWVGATLIAYNEIAALPIEEVQRRAEALAAAAGQ
jgi:hypothetical protein